MSKIWQILPKINEEFIKTYPQYDRVILQLLFNRGLTGAETIHAFFHPEEESDPFLFNDMAAAVGLIIKHIKEQNKITIYGDYDADGVTSSAVLYDTLKSLKARAEVYIPDRVSEGYGLNKKAIDEIASLGSKLLITVDGGIRAKEEVAYAKEKMEVIITDHHLPPETDEGMPDCLIINPVARGENYPFKSLAGVGVAYKVAKALISRSTLGEEAKRKLGEQILDLVAIGTVADCVSLLGENRGLVRRGLEVLRKTRRLGLKELFKAAQIKENKQLDSWNISFQIAPRLNAAGRMDHANTAFELLITSDKKEAEALARDLNDKNLDRQRITENIVDHITAALKAGRPEAIITAVSPKEGTWNEGVIGLAAGRISERFYRPTLVITQGEGMLKGSGRSVEGFNISKAVGECSLFLEKFGGHPAACGFSLKEEQLADFLEKIKAVAEEELKGADLRPRLEIESEIGLKEADLDLLKALDDFSPFGQNNDRPKFLSRNLTIVDINKLGLEGQHLKLRLKDEESGILSALGFGQAEQWKELRIGDKIDMVYYIELNEFNGRKEPQLKILDIQNA